MELVLNTIRVYFVLLTLLHTKTASMTQQLGHRASLFSNSHTRERQFRDYRYKIVASVFNSSEDNSLNNELPYKNCKYQRRDERDKYPCHQHTPGNIGVR